MLIGIKVFNSFVNSDFACFLGSYDSQILRISIAVESIGKALNLCRLDESYHLIASSGWTDTYRVAERKDSGITVPGVIDGWRDKLPADAEGMRLDYIWCSRRAEISSSRVVFNGTNEPIVSDHFGVLIETKES